jgi:hypothetical protein
MKVGHTRPACWRRIENSGTEAKEEGNGALHSSCSPIVHRPVSSCPGDDSIERKGRCHLPMFIGQIRGLVRGDT